MLRGCRAVDIYPGAWFKDIFDILKTVENPILSGFSAAECLRVDFVKNQTSLMLPSLARKDGAAQGFLSKTG